MSKFCAVRNSPGVYLFIGLDGNPLYAGQSSFLRTRLERHFIRQDSPAVADGLLDIYDVLRVYVWYADPRLALFPEEDDSVREPWWDLNTLEFVACDKFKPRWNRNKPVPLAGPKPKLTY